MLTSIETFLRGKKTYLVAVAAGAALTALYLGYIDQVTANWILSALGVTGVVTFRAAINGK